MLAERRLAAERMDDPALDVGVYRAVLADLAHVNRVTLAHRPTLRFLKRALRRARPFPRTFRLLDVGFGDGDMLRAIARWSRRHGLTADLVGIDLNPRSQTAAEAGTAPDLPIRYLTGDYAGLAGEGFDFVISSLVAHHMSEAELAAFLAFMEREARQGWFINDLHRHGVAYAAWPLLAGAMRWHPIVRADGHISIARAFRAGEWRALLARAGITEANVRRRFPFRLCVERVRSSPR